ncbi:MAG: tetratricopeptide repeat protein [Thermoanaerobaculia bacterium]|nr:tetratricopeptide repeat protein [Thermoanaerobaculia bacterium]
MLNPRPRRPHPALFPVLSGSLLYLAACASQPASFDSVAHTRTEAEARLSSEQSARFVVPYRLTPEILQRLETRAKPAVRETIRTQQVLDFIFDDVGLRYSLRPTRDAGDTFASAEGNCLSFVNLFVGVGRHYRMNPFYVEVRDHQRWRHSDGLVLSQGHMVAGMHVNGELQTFDFLPYRAKSYRNFAPIDDVNAAAHFYNNLAAEAMMDGDLDEALRLVEMAVSLAPRFEKAINNRGVILARRGDFEAALAAYRSGLEISPQDVALRSNLARLYQTMGNEDEAHEILAGIEELKTTNPYFYLFQAERSRFDGNLDRALDYLRRALRVDSEVPEVHVGLANYFLDVGDLDKARHHVDRALRLDATHREARRLAEALDQASRGEGGDTSTGTDR